MKAFGEIVTVILMMIISPLVNGYVFAQLWAWFIVPAFEVQPIRLVEAVGVVLLINFILAKKGGKVEAGMFWIEFTENVIFLFLMCGFALLSGWIVTLFM